MDRDFLKKQIFDSKDKGVSPLVFLNDQARDEFWAVLDSCKNKLEERDRNTSGTAVQKENIELKAKLDQANIKLAYLEEKTKELA